MNNTDEDRLARLCSAAVIKFGATSQEKMLVEELAELIVALQKHGRVVRGVTIDHVAEEIADVELALYQIKTIHHLDSAVELWKIVKLDRLEKILEDSR